MTPITMVVDPVVTTVGRKSAVSSYRYMSIVQADGPSFMRSMGSSTKDDPSHTLSILSRGDLPLRALEGQLGVVEHPQMGWVTASSWNAILVGESPAALVHANHLVYLLCPPPSELHPLTLDGRWVTHGKSLRVRGHTTKAAKVLLDFAARYNYQTIHFDAGWYGDESNRSSSPRVIAPQYAQELNFNEVANYAHARGVTITVYVNELALIETPALLELYPKWGVSGVKFGFVDVNSPRAMRSLHSRVLAYAHVGLSINIHDLYRPRGLSRTWPNLLTQEGVRGEERKPDATHHTILPFVRYLQGAADYTPRYMKSAIRCTRAHQLALPIVLFSPVQSLFWAEPAEAILNGVQTYLPELLVWQMMPTTWDDTRVLGGDIGEWVSIARRTGADWFIGSLTNTDARTASLNLSTLFDMTGTHPLPQLDVLEEGGERYTEGYMVMIYEDDHSYIVDTSLDTNYNEMRVRLVQRYILPPKFSSHVSRATRPLAAGAVFPNDPLPIHVASLQDYRRRIRLDSDARVDAMYTKEFNTKRSGATVMESPIVEVRMAKSGGNVIFITPIVPDTEDE
jgi:hypothetical protein